MTPDPKEAAIQRLALAFADAYDAARSADCLDVVELVLARIAIEQGVRPTVEASHHLIIESLKRSTPKEVYVDVRIPWDAVCADSAQQEKAE